ncbi:hypothetical protein ACWZHB_31315 [Nocardia sp. FBN12]
MKTVIEPSTAGNGIGESILDGNLLDSRIRKVRNYLSAYTAHRVRILV